MESTADKHRADAQLRFVCSACGTSLVLQDATQVVSGPCPKCSAWIDTSQFSRQKEPTKSLEVQLPSKSTPEHKRSRSMVSGRGRLRADDYLDQEYGQRKELYGTIKVLAVSLVVLAVILLVTLYLKQWMTY